MREREPNRPDFRSQHGTLSRTRKLLWADVAIPAHAMGAFISGKNCAISLSLSKLLLYMPEVGEMLWESMLVSSKPALTFGLKNVHFGLETLNLATKTNVFLKKNENIPANVFITCQAALLFRSRNLAFNIRLPQYCEWRVLVISVKFSIASRKYAFCKQVCASVLRVHVFVISIDFRVPRWKYSHKMHTLPLVITNYWNILKNTHICKMQTPEQTAFASRGARAFS